MNSIVRLLLFFFLCIPLRLLLAYIPQVLPKPYFFVFGVMIGLMGLGFLYHAFANTRLQAPEGGGQTWWASYRFIHGMLFMTALIYLIKKDRKASIPLLIDVILGILLFFVVRVGF